MKSIWGKRLSCLTISAAFGLIGNQIYSTKAGAPVSIMEGLPGMVLILIISILGMALTEAIDKVVPKNAEGNPINLPDIAYISLLAIIVTIPGFPMAEFSYDAMNKIGLLPLCTPILAYAGISMGKDLNTFKQQGLKIVLVALLTFTGTYVGSAIIAEVVLRVTGVI